MTIDWHNILNAIKHGRFNQLARIALLALFVIVITVSYHFYKVIWPAPYIAKQEGFQITFSQAPSVTKLPSEKVSGGEETGEIYSLQSQSSGVAYLVYVTNYPHINFASLTKNSTIGTLDNEIEILAKNNRANLSNGQNLTFKGLRAVEATLSPTDHSEKNSEVLAFLNKNHLYVIFGTGLSQSKFNSFTNTFKFIN